MSGTTITIIVLGAVSALLVGAVAAMVLRTKKPVRPTIPSASLERTSDRQQNPMYDSTFTTEEPPANFYHDLPSPIQDAGPEYLDIQPNQNDLDRGNTNL